VGKWIEMEEKKDNSLIYIIGGVAGALLGVAVAHVLLKSSESDEKPLQITPQKGVQIGLHTANFIHGLLSLIRKA
jgi:glycerol uptake facilitator-like aquaporin